jgi:hypothetical protein
MKTKDRIHVLGSLHVFAPLLGIALHATISFWPGLKGSGWHIVDSPSSWSVAVSYYLICAARMMEFIFDRQILRSG